MNFSTPYKDVMKVTATPLIDLKEAVVDEAEYFKLLTEYQVLELRAQEPLVVAAATPGVFSAGQALCMVMMFVYLLVFTPVPWFFLAPIILGGVVRVFLMICVFVHCWTVFVLRLKLYALMLASNPDIREPPKSGPAADLVLRIFQIEKIFRSHGYPIN